MKALSVLQPYAWLIVNGHKDIENRGWYTAHRGPFVVHAGKRYSRAEHDDYAAEFAEDFGIKLPAFDDMPRGAVVGVADLIDCVKEHPSRWKMDGSWGFVLDTARARTMPPHEYRGQLGFFKVDDDTLDAVYRYCMGASTSTASDHRG